MPSAHAKAGKDIEDRGVERTSVANLAAAEPETSRASLTGRSVGSYIFANPVACHQIAEALKLPVLVLILNNGGYDAVERSVVGLYPDGEAARANRVPLTAIEPSPDFVKVAEANRGYARRVDNVDDLPAALAAAIDHVGTRREQAMVEIVVG